MEVNNKKNQVVKAMTDVEYYPSVREDEISIEKYTKLPLAEVSAMGIAFEPINISVSKYHSYRWRECRERIVQSN